MTELASFESRVAECRARFRGWQWESAWFPVTQAAIDRYPESVADPDPMHVDPAWARANPPIGLNYGFDRIRLIAPVPVGSSIRGRIELQALEVKDAATALLRLAATVESDRSERPAVVAEWILALKQRVPA